MQFNQANESFKNFRYYTSRFLSVYSLKEEFNESYSMITKNYTL